MILGSKKMTNASKQLLLEERENFIALHPTSQILAKQAAKHFLYGVPMHWMNDWGTPTPLFVESAAGAHFTCADGIDYTDFCLGDTGAMFGHSPLGVAKAIANRLYRYASIYTGAKRGQSFKRFFWARLLAVCQYCNRCQSVCFALRARSQIAKKVLVFDGCYHGTVGDAMIDMAFIDDSMLENINGKNINRKSLLGQVQDLTLYSQAAPFNDLAAIERALKTNHFAALLTEPALTNSGMVLPQDGFIESLRALCTKYCTLLILDETHTISTAHCGWAKAHNITSDFLVVGKPIAGGLPAAAYGFSAEMSKKMKAAKHDAPPGHSGIGKTLSGNMMTLTAIYATLTETASEAAYRHMLTLARLLEHQLNEAISAHKLLWNISRMGARLELQFCKTKPINAKQARAAQNDIIESAIHLFLLNRGVLLTPFHNMMLVCPATNEADVSKLIHTFKACLQALTSA